MKIIKPLFFQCLASVIMVACTQAKEVSERQDNSLLLSDNIEFALAQVGNQIEIIEASGEVLNPVTVRDDGSIYYCGYRDWRSGFFPGSVWYLYELSGDTTLMEKAVKYTEAIEDAQYLTSHHDIGFIIETSFGNGLRLTGNEAYRDIIVQSAKSLATRFREQPGVIQSWDSDRGWQGERGWECPVIIDNMMNLELLFNATELSGDSLYYNIAVSHADRTLEEHFRPDGSTFHVIDYDLEDGSVRNRHTAQGYSHESAWSRGQAWAIYGYSMCYRETGEQRYLDQAIKSFEFLRDHPDMPEDLIPYWDMDAPDIPDALRDVSAATVIASALYEMSTFATPDAIFYKAYADKIIASLSTDSYKAELGTNGNFLLKHSVGSIPHDNEIDTPLNYADYYFLEALKRLKN
ncbi:Glycosyl Hydrolase Family 88 [Porphyromonadaceae bacterium NLAE-zl-C104]|nr:Glycosyl Hydrolase Family 88 [Porphyromonadaceae bacterium NLAE-zl-C104]